MSLTIELPRPLSKPKAEQSCLQLRKQAIRGSCKACEMQSIPRLPTAFRNTVAWTPHKTEARPNPTTLRAVGTTWQNVPDAFQENANFWCNSTPVPNYQSKLKSR